MKKIIAALLLGFAGASWAGTTNTVPKYTGTQTLGNSNVTDNGSTVTVNVPLSASTVTSVSLLRFADNTTQTTASTPGITGSGTANSVAKFTGTSAIGNGLLSDDGTNVTLSSGKMIAPNGSAGSPSFCFTGDQDVGMWRPTSNVLTLNGNNVQINDVTNNGAFTFDTQADTFQGTFNGTTAVAPAIKSLVGAGTTTGIYWPAAGTLGLTASGTSIFQGTTAGARVLATNTNDSAASGDYGEFASTTTTTFANIATSGQFGNVVSFSLTAGDWDVTGNVTLKLNGATITDYEVAVSSFSANTTTDHTEGYNWVESSALPIATANSSANVPRYRVSLSGTTTIYLKAKGAFTVATPQALGTMTARRAR